jgi:uncharacterized coiled-coil DUF342 family protein
MKTQSTEIEKELDQITRRLDQLVETRNGIDLDALQKDFINGEKTFDEFQAAQGKFTILGESIKGLEAKQDELHTAFQKASLSESNQKLLESATAAATEAETLFNESLEIRNELDAVIARLAENLHDKLSEFYDKRREYLAIRFKIQDGEKTPGISNQL